MKKYSFKKQIEITCINCYWSCKLDDLWSNFTPTEIWCDNCHGTVFFVFSQKIRIANRKIGMIGKNPKAQAEAWQGVTNRDRNTVSRIVTKDAKTFRQVSK